ncbi:MAG: cation transporter [Actinobacteria bacterium]|nr:cation transporter [Actinomycetota bacterium]
MTGPNHAPTVSSNRDRLAITFSITTTILVAEVVGAVLTGSLALLIDAAHVNPPEITSGLLAIFGIIGLVANISSIMVLASVRSVNFNLRAAFLEVVNDALGSAAVIIAAIIIATTGWMRADAVVAMLIGLLILPRTLKLIWETIDVLLESTPRGLNLESVRTHILELPHVRSVHDLHATQISTGLPVLTAHVVVDDECFYDGHAPAMIDDLQKCVAEHFEVQIEHSTFQLERMTHAEHEHPTHA